MARARRDDVVTVADVFSGGETNTGNTSSPEQPFGGIPSTLPGTEDEYETEQLTAIDQVKAQINAASPGARVYVYRVDPAKKLQDAYLFGKPATEFDLDEVLYEYGSGTYRIRGFVPQSEDPNKTKLFANKVIRIEAGRTLESRLALTSGTGNDGAVIQALNTMQTNMERLMHGVLTALTNTSKAPAPTRESMLQEMLMMRQIFESKSQQTDPLDSIVKLLGVVTQIRETVDPNAKPDLMSQALEVIGKPLASAVMAQALSTGSGQAMSGEQKPLAQDRSHAALEYALEHASVSNPAPAPAPAPAAPSANSLSEEQTMLHSGVAIVLNAARNNADVDTYANLILDNIGDANVAPIVRDDAVWNSILSQAPETAQFAPWFTQLRDALRELTEPEISDTPPSISPSNGKPGAP